MKGMNERDEQGDRKVRDVHAGRMRYILDIRIPQDHDDRQNESTDERPKR